MNLFKLFKKKQKESVDTDNSSNELESLAHILKELQDLQLEYCKVYHIGINTQCDKYELNYISVSIHTFIGNKINTSKYYSFDTISMCINNKELNMMKQYLTDTMFEKVSQ